MVSENVANVAEVIVTPAAPATGAAIGAVEGASLTDGARDIVGVVVNRLLLPLLLLDLSNFDIDLSDFEADFIDLSDFKPVKVEADFCDLNPVKEMLPPPLLLFNAR
jgi:hypothetical protein